LKTFTEVHLSHEQEAFKSFVLNTEEKIMQLWGGPGTGKSFILKQLIKEMSDKVMVTACSNGAADELGGLTIHRALGVRPIKYGSSNIDFDSILEGVNKDLSSYVVIVDEASMISEELYELILAANPKRLILVGDREQIPPVKAKTATFPKDNLYTFETNHRGKTEELKKLFKDMKGKTKEELLPLLPEVDNTQCPTTHCLNGGTYIAYTNEEVVRVSDTLAREGETKEFYFKMGLTASVSSLKDFEGNYIKPFSLPKKDPISEMHKSIALIATITSKPIIGKILTKDFWKEAGSFAGGSSKMTLDQLMEGISIGGLTPRVPMWTDKIEWLNVVKGNYGFDKIKITPDEAIQAEYKALINLKSGYSIPSEEDEAVRAIMMCMTYVKLVPLSKYQSFELLIDSSFMHPKTHEKNLSTIVSCLGDLEPLKEIVNMSKTKLLYHNNANYSVGSLIVPFVAGVNLSIGIYQDEALNVYKSQRSVRNTIRSKFISIMMNLLFKGHPELKQALPKVDGKSLQVILELLSNRVQEDMDDKVYAKSMLFGGEVFGKNFLQTSNGQIAPKAEKWMKFVLLLPEAKARNLFSAWIALQSFVLQMENIPAARDYRCMTTDMSQGKTIPKVMLNVKGLNAQRIYVGATRASEKLIIIER